jgi:ribosome recycling factor
LVFPQLTEERRREIVKQIHKYAEEAKVAVRNARRDAIEKLKAMKKTSELTEDDLKDGEKEAQKLTDKFCEEVDKLATAKEKEIMSI